MVGVSQENITACYGQGDILDIQETPVVFVKNETSDELCPARHIVENITNMIFNGGDDQ